MTLDQVQALFQTIDNRNTSAFLEFLTQDAVFRFGNSETVTGKENVGNVVEGFFGSIKSLKHTVLEVWDNGPNLVCHGTVTYTRHNESTLTVPFANILKMDAGKIKAYLIFVDVSGLYS